MAPTSPSVGIEPEPSMHRLQYRYVVLAIVLGIHLLLLALLLRWDRSGGREPLPGLIAVKLIAAQESSRATERDSAAPAAPPQDSLAPPRIQRISRPEVSKPSNGAPRDSVRLPSALEAASSPAATPETESRPQAAPTAPEPQRLLPVPLTPPSAEADYLSNPAPSYPRASRELREQGLVAVRVHVTTNGEPDDVQLQRSSGYARLDQAAVDVVWHWRFVPAHQGDEDVAGWVIVPIRFTLKS